MALRVYQAPKPDTYGPAQDIGARLTCHQHDTIMPNPLQNQHIQAAAQEPHPAEYVLVHVVGQMLGADAVVRAFQPRLEIGECAVHARELLGSAVRIADGSGLVVVLLAQRGVSLPAVRQQRAAWLHRSLDERYKRLGRDIPHYGEPYAARTATTHLDGTDDDGLVAVPLTSATESLLGPAHVRFVHLDGAREAVSFGAHHRAAELLHHRPSRLVPVEPELSLELKRREPGGVGRHQVGRPEPQVQRKPGAVHDRACRHRCLMPARAALQQSPRIQFVRFSMAASRTPVPVGPTAFQQVPPTVVLGSEARVTDRPNGATPDRPNGATQVVPISGLRRGDKFGCFSPPLARGF